MSRYTGLFTFDEDTHKYVPIAMANDIIDQDLQTLRMMGDDEE